MKRLLLVCLFVSCLGSLAAAPPYRVAYQGVLRNDQDAPLDGTYDMVFRFFSSGAGGDEILVDTHDAGGGSAVVVAGGLFTVDLGGGVVSDGGGPGTYTTLADVFRGYPDVWLEIRVGAETLSPRVRVLSAPWALHADNAGRLEGRPAGDFLDTSSSTQTKTGKLIVGGSENYGIESVGTVAGALFSSLAGSAFSFAAVGDVGVHAGGNSSGGYFENLGLGSSSAAVATVGTGIDAAGISAGGHFADENGTSETYVAYGSLGIDARGATTGGYFATSNASASAYVADAGHGIRGYGANAGGYFDDTNGSGNAYVGYGDYGIQGFGSFAGGYFKCNGTGNTGEVWLGDHNRGVWSRGTEYGGFFYDSDGSGYATLGVADTGIVASGSFQGIEVTGGSWAGYFQDSTDGAEVYLAFGPQGIQARGPTYGGYFVDTDSGGQAYVGFSSYKIQGVGTVSFVQNHPDEPDRVIVYHAPEASEVAVYSRGSGRLEAGTAKIALDPTFAWVANPDLGLTAHLTPRGVSCGLHVTAVSTAELVVGSDDARCESVEFDYMVWGLRIGFEELAPVQPKRRESWIPSMEDHRALYRDEPELRAFTAESRFEELESKLRGRTIDKSAGRAAGLLARIGEYDPAVHGPVADDGARERSLQLAARPADPGDASSAGQPLREGPVAAPAVAVESHREPGEGPAAARPESLRFPVSGDVEPGDVLVLDPDRSGHLRRAVSMADPGVVGLAAAPSSVDPRSGAAEVEVVGAGFARVNADAGYGAIRAGDLLVSSPTAGHAMRATDVVAGTVLGKALDGLEVGTGTIRVLLMSR